MSHFMRFCDMAGGSWELDVLEGERMFSLQARLVATYPALKEAAPGDGSCGGADVDFDLVHGIYATRHSANPAERQVQAQRKLGRFSCFNFFQHGQEEPTTAPQDAEDTSAIAAAEAVRCSIGWFWCPFDLACGLTSQGDSRRAATRSKNLKKNLLMSEV